MNITDRFWSKLTHRKYPMTFDIWSIEFDQNFSIFNLFRIVLHFDEVIFKDNFVPYRIPDMDQGTESRKKFVLVSKYSYPERKRWSDFGFFTFRTSGRRMQKIRKKIESIFGEFLNRRSVEANEVNVDTQVCINKLHFCAKCSFLTQTFR